jgi:hypothetical protein
VAGAVAAVVRGAVVVAALVAALVEMAAVASVAQAAPPAYQVVMEALATALVVGVYFPVLGQTTLLTPKAVVLEAWVVMLSLATLVVVTAAGHLKRATLGFSMPAAVAVAGARLEVLVLLVAPAVRVVKPFTSMAHQ